MQWSHALQSAQGWESLNYWFDQDLHVLRATCNNCKCASYWEYSFKFSSMYTEEELRTAGRGTPQELIINIFNKLQTLKPEFSLRAKMTYPAYKRGPVASEDMPRSIRKNYEEARIVAQHSPRAAAALLRLCIERLCLEWVPEDKKKLDLNKLIGYLVEVKQIDDTDQKLLDTVRIVGNNVVHPGRMEESDVIEIVDILFYLINDLINKHVTAPKTITKLYSSLPPSLLKGVEDRDKSKS